MKKLKKITLEQCCVIYNIQASFVYELEEHGLIELSIAGKKNYIGYEQLNDLEKYIRMHFDLEINMEGMEAIKHLLVRIEKLQQENKRLRLQFDE